MEIPIKKLLNDGIPHLDVAERFNMPLQHLTPMGVIPANELDVAEHFNMPLQLVWANRLVARSRAIPERG